MDGPAAILLTVGGNDLRLAHASGASHEEARSALRARLESALRQVLEPGRFGSGVEVRVYVANLYDPTDGSGDFSGCRGASVPRGLGAEELEAWNRTIAAAVRAQGQYLVDAHRIFRGHGKGAQASWYMRDCIHPNQLGNMELAAGFHVAIFGKGPDKEPEAPRVVTGPWIITLKNGQRFRSPVYEDLGETVRVQRWKTPVEMPKSKIESVVPDEVGRDSGPPREGR